MTSGEVWIRASDLVGPAELRELLDVDRTEIEQLVSSPGFPSPVVRTGPGGRDRLWSREQVRFWAQAKDRSTGTPMAEATEPEVEQALMTATEVAAKLGWMSPSTAWDLVKRGRFPAPVRQHGRMKLWSRAQVENWERTAPRKPRRPASGIASS